MFRTEIELVQVEVIATNADGRFLEGLAKDDFELLEDGKRQRIDTFQGVDVPIKDLAVRTARN